MTAHTDLPNSLFLQDKPILGSTGMALRDNPIAISEGAPGAPRIAHRALTSLYLGGSNGSGSGYSFTLTGTENLGVIDGEIDWALPPGAEIVFQASTDGGSTWGSQQVMLSTGPGTSRRMMINLLTGEWRVHPNLSGTFTIPSGCNAIRLKPDSGASGSTTLAVMAWAAGGIID